MVVVGTSPIETFWREAIAKEVESLADRIKFSWTDHLSFEELLKQASMLPPKSAIFWELMIVDASGVVHEGAAPLSRLHAVANAPIFSYDESFFGREIVGGPLLLVIDSSRRTAAVAVRILGGEKPSGIDITPVPFANPRFDWRQLQRWSISESRLSPGSEIYFRDPSPWEQYRAQILAICAAVLLQAALIGWLVLEHRRRHLAEIRSRNSMAELTFMNRRAAAGELSASIAHEVNQPLTAIAAKAGAALRWLRRETPDLEHVRASLQDIVAAAHRAGDIVTSVRAMFRNSPTERITIEINGLIQTVLSIVRIDLQKAGVELDLHLDEGLPTVQGDKIQLQQVILNLVTNSIDAMRSSKVRLLTVKTTLLGGMVRVSIEDTGTGVDPANLGQIFKPLFTTKETGTGMGLAICQSIIDSHGGRIWATAAVSGGSIFQFELPMNGCDVDRLAGADLAVPDGDRQEQLT